MPKEQKTQGKFTPFVDPEIVLKGFGLQAFKRTFYSVRQDTEGQDENAPSPVPTTYLGTPVFCNLELIPGEYTNKDGDPIKYGGGVGSENFRIDTVLIDVSQQKQIIKTPIQGVSGTVKEYISKGDYQVKVRGALVDQSAQRYPQEQAQQLREFLEVEDSIGIASRFLNDVFEVQEIVIDSFSFPQVEGFQNVQLFEFSAISDDPIELTVINNLFSEGASF